MLPRNKKKIETFWNRCPTVQRVVHAERIHDITYHISSSPYYSEGMHTKYTIILGVLLKGAVDKGKLDQNYEYLNLGDF
jgi:hypothetical protein